MKTIIKDVFDATLVSIAIIMLALCFTSCTIKSKPVVVDPCAKAATECWGNKGVEPSTIPMCEELIKCSAWEMSAT